MGLIQELIKTGEKKTVQPLQDENGFWYYPEQPEGTRPATTEDIESGSFRAGAPFIMHGFHSGRFECYRSNGIISESLREFIECGRVYLFTKQ